MEEHTLQLDIIDLAVSKMGRATLEKIVRQAVRKKVIDTVISASRKNIGNCGVINEVAHSLQTYMDSNESKEFVSECVNHGIDARTIRRSSTYDVSNVEAITKLANQFKPVESIPKKKY